MKSKMRLVLPFILIAAICLQAPFAMAQAQKRLKFSDVFLGIPQSTVDAFSMSFNKDAIPAWIGILGSTAILYHYDDDVIREGQKLGRTWGLSNHDETKTFVELGPYNILRLPTDAGSSLYYLGDGWLHSFVALSFLANGHITDETRPINTGIELIHGMVTSTIFSQILKRAFGRQSPNQSTEPRGKWRPFPSINAYNTRTAEYDAMPSGHVMTATLTFTILRGNYPEYDHVLLPLEVVWLSALGFGMVNNGVHWASDYPLGIAMGYVFGKAALNLGKQDDVNSGSANSSMFFPSIDQQTLTANWIKHF